MIDLFQCGKLQPAKVPSDILLNLHKRKITTWAHTGTRVATFAMWKNGPGKCFNRDAKGVERVG